MLRPTTHPLLSEPRAPDPPARVGRDWVVLVVAVSIGLVEMALTVELAWLPVGFLLGVAPMVTILWRRPHPLAMTAIAFGFVALTSIFVLLGVPDSVSLYSSLYVLLMPYALFRWGSGREAVVGLAIIVTVQAFTEAVAFTGTADVVLGAVFYLFPAAVAAAVRYRTSSQLRETEKIHLVARELLARELHDTVAHHVTAIAVQAEAGLARSESGQGGAIEELEAIKLAASRALTEMRSLVGILRQGEEPELTPQPGMADLERLAQSSGGELAVDLEMADDLGEFMPAVGAAVYRIAQEAITNSVRHAHQASRIRVSVAGSEEHITVVVSDDGTPSRIERRSAGYGLVGMAERVNLIGGTLEVGPGPDAGWNVTASLPRRSSER